MQATYRSIVCALVMGMLVSVVTPVMAMPAGPWEPGGGGGGEDPPVPEMPPCGYITTDCPSATYMGWSMESYDVFSKPYGILERTGPAVGIWMSSHVPGHYASVQTNYFMDFYHDYGWPAQTMPMLNATIQSVYLIVLVYTSGSSFNGYLQLSIDAGANFYPSPNTHPEYYQTMSSPSGYSEYLFNVTNLPTWTGGSANWTAQMMMDGKTFVRLFTDDFISEPNAIYVDYLGFRYNWTLPGAGTQGEGPTWSNSTLGMLNAGSWFIGGMGTLGFVGMITVPALGIILVKRTEDKAFMTVKVIGAFTLCFGLFLGSIL